MGWGGKAVGAGLGALFGGPLGAVIGAGIGGLLDTAADDGPSSSPPAGAADAGEARLEGLIHQPSVCESGPALQIVVHIKADTPIVGETSVVFRFRDGDRYIQGEIPEYRDDEGEAVTVGQTELESNREAGIGVGVLPIAALAHWPAKLTIEAVLVTESEALADGLYELDLPSREEYEAQSLLGALVYAAVGVVRADAALESPEVKYLRDELTTAFDLDTYGVASLKRMLQRANAARNDPASAARRMASHLGERNAPVIVGMLYEVAAADGRVTKAEEDWISHFCEALGIPLSVRAETRRELGLDLSQHYAVLELQEGASMSEIKNAYRRLAAEFHPDKVATMSPRWQAIANQKMKDINAAHEALRKALST